MSKVATNPISDLSFVEGENLNDAKFPREELQAAEQVVAQFLSDAYPELDFFTDSTIYDLIIRPSSVLYLIFRRQIETFRNTMSVKDIEANPELAEAEVVAAVLSNYLIALNTGSNAQGVAKIQVSSDRTFRLRQDLVFTSQTGLEFTLDQTVVTTNSDNPSEGQIRLIQPDPAVENWIFYVPVTAVEAGSLYNIPAGTQLEIGLEFTDLSLITANLDFSGGTDGEGFEDLNQKILDSLSARNMVSRSSIFSTLRDQIPTLTATNTQGMGDDLIFRNRNTLIGTPVGGIVDVYVRTSAPPSYKTIEKTAKAVSGETLKYSFTLNRDDAPGHYFIRNIRPAGGPYLGTYKVDSETVRINTSTAGVDIRPNLINEVGEGTYSRWQETDVVIEVEPFDPQVSDAAGELTVAVEVFYMPRIDEIQELLSAEDNRVAGTDFLARGFIPCFLSFSEIRVRVASATQVTADAIRAAVSAYVHSITPGGGVRVDEVVCAIKGIAGVLSVDLPIRITGEVFSPDADRTRVTFNSRSVLNVPTDLTLGVGPANTAFFVEPGQIPITITEG